MPRTQALQRNRHSPPLTVAPPQADFLTKVDSILDLPAIPGPKPWTDDVERAAVWHTCHASTPVMALCSSGASLTAAKVWLSDEPPEAYRSACVALAGRLKAAEHVCSQTLLGRIYAASDDPKHWTAAAWIMERSRGYVVQQQQLNGPATVVNIGTLNVVQGERPRISWRDDPEVIEAPALVESLVVEDKA